MACAIVVSASREPDGRGGGTRPATTALMSRSRLWLPVLVTVVGFTALTGSSAQAQSHVVQAWGTLGSTSARDDLLVPLGFTGPAIGLGARYSLAAGRQRAEAELQLGIGLLHNRFDHQAEQLSHGLAAGYRYTLANGSELGGIVRWHDELSYLESWDDAHGYWLSQLVVGVTARDARMLRSAVALEMSADLALFGVVSRPPARRTNKQDALTHVGYHIDRLGEGTQLAWIGNTQSLRIESIARFRTGARPTGSGLGVGLFATLARTTVAPEPYTLLAAGVVCGFGWEL
jgi:hypothetical protein